MIAVTKASLLDDFRLRIEFNDGAEAEVDCTSLLDAGLGMALRDAAYFRQVTADQALGTVVWPNGRDPAPELLRRRLSVGV